MAANPPARSGRRAGYGSGTPRVGDIPVAWVDVVGFRAHGLGVRRKWWTFTAGRLGALEGADLAHVALSTMITGLQPGDESAPSRWVPSRRTEEDGDDGPPGWHGEGRCGSRVPIFTAYPSPLPLMPVSRSKNTPIFTCPPAPFWAFVRVTSVTTVHARSHVRVSCKCVWEGASGVVPVLSITVTSRALVFEIGLRWPVMAGGME